MWVCATPATWNEGGCHQVPRLPRKQPRRQRYVCESVWSYCMLSLCVCEVIVCERWYVTKLCVCVKLLYVKFVCVWSYGMWHVQVVIVCERWYVTKLCVWVCVKLLYVKFVCVKFYGMWHVWRWRQAAGGGGDPGYRIKNKNPTQSCGE